MVFGEKNMNLMVSSPSMSGWMRCTDIEHQRSPLSYILIFLANGSVTIEASLFYEYFTGSYC